MKNHPTFPVSIFPLLCACALLAADVAPACSVTPAAQTVPKEELVERTKTIVLARVAKMEALPNGTVKYTFKTERKIKGAAEAEFTIDGVTPEPGGGPGTFNDHAEESFWNTPRGRLVHDTDCQIHPSFTVGGVYVIFLDAPYHQKSFEQVEKISDADKDPWLAWVEEQVKKAGK